MSHPYEIDYFTLKIGKPNVTSFVMIFAEDSYVMRPELNVSPRPKVRASTSKE